jgi:hypothetical protein
MRTITKQPPVFAAILVTWVLAVGSASAQNWTLTTAPTNAWSAITGSGDLTVIAAVVNGGGIYNSTNAGTNWNLSDAPSNRWSAIACSTNGANMVSAVNGSGIWISRDSGSSWRATAALSNAWAGLACSADGELIVATASGGIWRSVDSGASWNLTSAATNNFEGSAASYGPVASSTDGNRLVTLETGPGSSIWLSADGGASWTQTLGSYPWGSVTSSANGEILAAASYGVALSTNAGTNWTFSYPDPAEPPGFLGCSADGSKLGFLPISDLMAAYFSADAGRSWESVSPPSQALSSLVLSADGNQLVGAADGGGIYKWQPTTPLIATQPQTQTDPGGLTGILSAGVFSIVALTYQWHLDGTNLVGATGAELLLPALNLSNSGTYAVLVSNTYGAVLSSNATLVVVPAFVSTLSADWGISDAILGGSVSTGPDSTAVWFNWGTDTNYGNATVAYDISDAVVSLNFSNRITGLAPYATYHYQAVASNIFGVAAGSDATFTTAPRFVLTSGTNGGWDDLALSADGSTMYASWSGTLYISTNSGADWVSISDADFTAFIPSADGTKLAAISASVFYLSTNSGKTWLSNSTPATFGTFAASADLSNLVAVGGSQIYVSTNSGAAWSLTSAPSENWISIATSADGTQVVALDEEGGPGEGVGGAVYRSANSGASWAYVWDADAEYFISGIACSANGATLIMTGEFSYISTNSGVAWSFIPDGPPGPVGPDGGLAAACSADGTTLAISSLGFLGAGTPGIYISPDSGGSWVLANAPGADSVLISSNGTEFAALENGYIYISQANPVPVLDVTISNSNLLISWMLPVDNFILQQSSDLVNWSTVTKAPILNFTNLQNQVTLPLSQTQSFYRLITP